jgi:hypothetical protein
MIAGLLLLGGPIYLVFGVLSRLYIRNQRIPDEGFFSIGIFATIGFWVFLLMVYFVKIIITSNDGISIIFPFRFKRYKYNIAEIEKYKVYTNNGKYKDYETLHFQTTDKKVFMIMQYEYRNYKRIRSFFESNSTPGELSNYSNLIPSLILLVIAIGMTIGLIQIFNHLII